jgi:hypothetical protein
MAELGESILQIVAESRDARQVVGGMMTVPLSGLMFSSIGVSSSSAMALPFFSMPDIDDQEVTASRRITIGDARGGALLHPVDDPERFSNR